MKNLFSKLMLMATMAIAFTACEDVPEPYDLPGHGKNDPNAPVEGEYLSESFNSSLGSFTNVLIAGVPWGIDHNTAKASGYAGGTTTPSEAYLVSKAIDLSASKEAYLEYEYILRYVSEGNTVNKTYITDNYTGDPKTTTWTDITGTLKEGKDWDNFEKSQVQLPESMIGKSSVVIAFYYSCTTTSSTMEIKNLKVKEGKVSEPEDPEKPGTGDGTQESPYDVTRAMAVATGTGVYVKGYIIGSIDGKSMKDGAIFSATTTVETNLILAASADETDVANCMPIALPSGSDVRTKLNLKANAANYKKEVTLYGNITTYFSAVGLKEVTYAILDGTEIGKKPGDDPTPAGAISVNFKTDGFGEWTIDDKTKPTEIAAIWKHDTKYGLVATAYESASKKNFDSESWVVSPKYNLSSTAATLTIHHAINFFTSVDVAKTEAQVMVSTDGSNWTALTLSGWPTKLSWTFFDSTADVSAYAGKKNVQFALKYTSTSTKAGTWEVEKITVE